MVDQSNQGDVYHKLTPVDNVDLGEYENAMLYALNQTDIRNIAITGVYGSGKSSLIKTFESKYQNDNRFNFLNISLASFVMEPNPKFDNEESPSSKFQKNETQDIEKSLLQQIIFKVKSDVLEDSQFSRIKIKRYCLDFLISNFWSAFFLISLILSIKFVFKPDYYLFKGSWLFNQDYMSYFLLFAVIGCLGLVQLLLNFLPRLGLSKLSAGGAEISFNERRGDSILNKHLDELIYFFATTRFNIVVFEDLDRLPSREILIKLREINQLINNSEEINKKGKNKVVKFVFALGDHLFTDAIDRTKFFDFIIPVIPVVNHSNSRQKFEEAIKQAFPQIELKSNFLDEVTQFLDDMRMLFNIANEFIVYKKHLDADSDQSATNYKLRLDNTKLLALIIYKNKNPEDFAALNQRQGKVWGILNSKTKLIEALKVKISDEINKIKEQVIHLEGEKLADINELKRSYLAYYFLNYANFYSFQINGKNYDPKQVFENDSLFELLRTQTNIRYTTQSSSHALPPFTSVEQQIYPSLKYQERVVRLTQKTDGAVATLNSELSRYEKDLDNIQRLSLSQLALRQPESAFGNLGDDDDLIKYLIIEGLIGEDFLTYTTYFYPGELSSNDQQYLISQLSNTPLDVTYKLENPEKVFEKIKDERFKSFAILNLDILTYSSLNRQNTKKANSLIETIINSKDIGKDLIQKWLKLATLDDISKRYVLNRITKKDGDFWSQYLENINLTSNEKVNLLISLLEYLDEDALKLINQSGIIQFELKDNIQLLDSINVLGYDKLTKLFKQFNIVISNIESCSDIQLLDVIEKTNAYQITIGNLIKLLSASNSVSEKVIPTYSYIRKYGSEEIKEYIQRELRWFASDVLLSLESPQEEESSALHLLESDELEHELKLSLVNKLNFKLKDIESVSDQLLWAELFASKRVEATWRNVIKYFQIVEQDLDEVLVSYLGDEENLTTLIKGYLRLDVADELNLARKIIGCEDIADDVYQHLIRVILIRFSDLSDIEVSKNKIDALLRVGRFSLTSENHKFLINNLPEKSHLLLAQNFDEFIQELSEIGATSNELINLVKGPELNNSQKVNLVNLTPDGLYDARLAKAYCEYILSRTKEKFPDIKLIKKILFFGFDQDLKIRLFNRYNDELDHTGIIEIISKMPSGISKIVENKRVLLRKDNENIKFATFLSSHQYINFRVYRKDDKQLELIARKKILKQ